MANELGLRSVVFEDDLQAAVDGLAADACGLVGGIGRIGQHENILGMAYVRGPEGIVVALVRDVGDDCSKPIREEERTDNEGDRH